MRLPGDIERDLARLADGTLAPERAREVEARVAESPELGSLLAQQRRSLNATALLDERAPEGLRQRVEQLQRKPSRSIRVRRAGFATGLVATAAAAAAVIVAILPSAAAGPSLAQASAFTLQPPSAPPPPHRFDGQLALKVDGVPYPYWSDDFGWKASGSRVDKISGRTATTVFYSKGKMRVGYTIVSGKPVSVDGKPAVTMRNGTRFRSLPIRGATVVTWERRDHSCILSGRNVPRSTLIKLAAWKDEGELPYAGQ